MLQPHQQQTPAQQEQQQQGQQQQQQQQQMPVHQHPQLQQQFQQHQQQQLNTQPPPHMQVPSQGQQPQLQLQQQLQAQQLQRYQYLQQQKLQQGQQLQIQQQQQQQQYANSMLPLSSQNTASTWNQQSISLSQPSDPALQRLGVNRRLSSHMQRLPSISSINASSPLSTSMSPNGSHMNENILHFGPASPSISHSQYPSLNISSNNPSPEKSLFKNFWGFNSSDNQVSPTTTSFPPPPPHVNPSLKSHQPRMHSISEIPQFASNYNPHMGNLPSSPNANVPRKSFMGPPALKMSTPQESAMANDPSSPQKTNFNLRSKSFAVSKSKFSLNLPTTHEIGHQDQTLSFGFGQAQDHGYTDREQLRVQQRRLSLLPPLDAYEDSQPHHRLSQQFDLSRYNNSSNNSNNHTNVGSRVLLESQQQQIIPPLRAEGPVLTSLNANNSNTFNNTRRESVAAVQHHQHAMPYQMVGNSDHLQLSSYEADPVDGVKNYTNHYLDNKPSDSLPPGYSQNPNFVVEDYYPVDNGDKSFFKQKVKKNHLKLPKFHKVASLSDLKPTVNDKPKFRRVSSSQSFVSPLSALTTQLNLSYSMCVPEYDYQKSKNPRRALTKNSKPCHNGGYDNESYDYILYVNDILGTEENKKYLVLDILGQGTFGQVVKCQNLKTQEIVAVKVIKARQECLQQSIAEGNVLEYLDKKVDPKYKKYFINLKDKFMHKYHLCLVFKLLSSNLYEIIKQNHHHGLCIKLVRNFAAQILEALCALKEIKIIHCDLKPENILLAKLNKPDLKIIDFGSACEEHQILYSYVQSRFYRSPEVILGVDYSTSVDMWSFGCIVAELFLGLPLLPGTSEYEQLARMVQTFGMPPPWMMVEKKASNYIVKSENPGYNYFNDKSGGRYTYRLKTLEEFNREFNLHESPAKQYFCDTKLDNIIMNYRLPRQNMSKEMVDKEMHERSCLVHFLKGVLNISPLERWTPQEALQHPFITGELWNGQWSPPTARFSNDLRKGGRSLSLV